MLFVTNSSTTGTVNVEFYLSGWKFSSGTYSSTGTFMGVAAADHYVSGVIWSGNTGSLTDQSIIANPVHLEFAPYVCSTVEYDYSVSFGTGSREEVIYTDPIPRLYSSSRGMIQQHTMKKYSTLKAQSWGYGNSCFGIAATSNRMFTAIYEETANPRIFISRGRFRTPPWHNETIGIYIYDPGIYAGTILKKSPKMVVLSDSVGFVVYETCAAAIGGGEDTCFIRLVKFDFSKPLDDEGNHFVVVATVQTSPTSSPNTITYNGVQYGYSGDLQWMVNSRTFTERSIEQNVVVFSTVWTSETGNDKDILVIYFYDVNAKSFTYTIAPLSDVDTDALVAVTYQAQPCITEDGVVWFVCGVDWGVGWTATGDTCACPVFCIDPMKKTVTGAYNYKYDQSVYNQIVVGSASMKSSDFCFSIFEDTAAVENETQRILKCDSSSMTITEIANRLTAGADKTAIRLLNADSHLFLVDPPMAAATGNIYWIGDSSIADWTVFWNFPKFSPDVEGNDLAKYIFMDRQNQRVWGLWDSTLTGKSYALVDPGDKTIDVNWPGGSYPGFFSSYDEYRTQPFMFVVSGMIITAVQYSKSSDPPARYVYNIYSLIPEYPASDTGVK